MVIETGSFISLYQSIQIWRDEVVHNQFQQFNGNAFVLQHDFSSYFNVRMDRNISYSIQIAFCISSFLFIFRICICICFLATLVALHLTPVSESVSEWAEFRTSVA